MESLLEVGRELAFFGSILFTLIGLAFGFHAYRSQQKLYDQASSTGKVLVMLFGVPILRKPSSISKEGFDLAQSKFSRSILMFILSVILAFACMGLFGLMGGEIHQK